MPGGDGALARRGERLHEARRRPARARSRSRPTSATGATRSSTRSSSIASPTATWATTTASTPRRAGNSTAATGRASRTSSTTSQELGVTTLWISPVVKNVETDADFDGYHGYWAQDLDHAQPALRRPPRAAAAWSRAAHERDMKVILDIVTNHMGQLFYYDINMNGQPDEHVSGGGCDRAPRRSDRRASRHLGIKHVNEYDPDFDPRGVQALHLARRGRARRRSSSSTTRRSTASRRCPRSSRTREAYNRKGRTYNFDDRDQLLHGDFPGGLKDVNTTRCDVQQAMVDSYARWVELADLDGFRIDTVKHVEREFWRDFAQKVRQRLDAQGKNNFLMFGEAFDGNDELVGTFTKNDLRRRRPQLDARERVRHRRRAASPATSSTASSTSRSTSRRSATSSSSTAAAPQRIADLWAKRADELRHRRRTARGIGVAPHEVAGELPRQPRRRRASSSAARRKRQALPATRCSFLFTEEGIPCVYYGTEQELRRRQRPGEPRGPLAHRLRPPTQRDVPAASRSSRRLRKKYAALRRGDQKVVWATSHTGDEPDAGIFAFERAGGDAGDGVRAGRLQHQPEPRRARPKFDGAPMKVTAPPGTVLVDVLARHEHATPSAATARSTVTLAAVERRAARPARSGRRELASAAHRRSNGLRQRLAASIKRFGQTDVLKGVDLDDPRGRLRRARRAERLRQVDAAPPPRRPRDRPTRGPIRFGDRDVTRLEPRDRDIAMVFQSLRALPAPHRARQPRLRPQAAQGRPRPRSRSASPRPREMLGLGPLLDRLPRAALRRPATARRDGPRHRAARRRSSSSTSRSPTSTPRSRAQVRVDIRKLHDRLGATSVYVTHDQVEAMTLADVLFVLNRASSSRWARRSRSTRARAPGSSPASSAARR